MLLAGAARGGATRDAKQVEKDAREARNHFSRAAEHGDPAALAALARLHETGVGVERVDGVARVDLDEALRGFGAAAARGLIEGAEGVRRVRAAKAELAELRARKQAERAVLLKSAGYEAGSLGPPENIEREIWAACAWVAKPLAENQAAAEAGDAAAQDAMGRRLFKEVSPEGPEGPMVREAVVRCASWFRRAADRPEPNISAMSMLGSMLAAREFSGDPGPLSLGVSAAAAAAAGAGPDNGSDDAALSVVWHRRAAVLGGDPRASYNLGLAFEEGRGCVCDLEEAARWYAKAADRGYTLAVLGVRRIEDKRLEAAAPVITRCSRCDKKAAAGAGAPPLSPCKACFGVSYCGAQCRAADAASHAAHCAVLRAMRVPVLPPEPAVGAEAASLAQNAADDSVEPRLLRAALGPAAARAKGEELVRACKEKRSHDALRLIDSGADVDAADGELLTPLMYVIRGA
jgi:TPR repeat protein